MLSQHIHKKYEINWGKKKVVYQPGTKLATPDFKRDLPLVHFENDKEN